MEKFEFILSLINDSHDGNFGTFPILTSPAGNSFIKKGKSIYSFNREFKHGSEIIVATSFEHAFDLYELNEKIKSLRQENKNLWLRLLAYETSIIKKLGKKLRGIKRDTKLRNFLK